jgi:hypothetical protein
MQVVVRLVVLIVAGALTVDGCSSEKKLGESCEETGKTDGECESGTICGTQTSGALQCLKVCAAQADCPADQECNGVEGSSTKGCRVKSATTTGGLDGGKK